ncbi:MAG: hypothetical protein JXD19_05235 [Deltaproteobacteria bacterium]|nr:hypothetical protein [Deltaproteobacteria bacterium]
MLGVLISLFILIALFIQFLRWKLSRWNELSEKFPAYETIPGIEFYKNCPGQAGRFSFSKRDQWQFSVGFTPEGIIIRLKSKKYKDLLVPWDKIRSAAKYSLGSRSAAKVIIESDIPLSFYLSEEVLPIFETWHRVEQKPLEDLLDRH